MGFCLCCRKKSIRVKTGEELFKNNYAFANTSKAHFEKLEADAKAKPDYTAGSTSASNGTLRAITKNHVRSRARHTDQSRNVIGGQCLRSSQPSRRLGQGYVAGEQAVKIIHTRAGREQFGRSAQGKASK